MATQLLLATLQPSCTILRPLQLGLDLLLDLNRMRLRQGQLLLLLPAIVAAGEVALPHGLTLLPGLGVLLRLLLLLLHRNGRPAWNSMTPVMSCYNTNSPLHHCRPLHQLPVRL